jgi:hypothetical protein
MWIKTTHQTTLGLWILDEEGREASVRVEEDIPLKEGHQVTIVEARLEGHCDCRLCLIVHHTACDAFFLDEGMETVKLTTTEWSLLCLTPWAMLVSLLVGMLVSLHGSLGTGLVVDCSGILFGSAFASIWLIIVLCRKSTLRRKFRRHCGRIAETIL